MKKFFTLIAWLAVGLSGAYAQYCLPSYTNGTIFGDSVVAFQLGAINASFPGSPSGYNDYTLLTSTTLNAGATYTATMIGNPDFAIVVAIWIDYNQDTVFDASEKLGEVNVPTSSSAGITFTVPPSALSGNTRLRMTGVFFGSNITPCGSYSFGETEDYTVNILPPAPNDVGVTWIQPKGTGCGLSATEQVTVQLTNFGTNSQPSFPVSFQLNNGTVVTETYTGPLAAAGGVDTFTFAATVNMSAQNTLYSLDVWSGLVGDANAANDTFNLTLTTPTILTLPFNEDFESFIAGSPGTLDPGWTIEGGSAFEGWNVETDGIANSFGTGPIDDHTTGGQTYMFTETSSGILGNQYRLVAPCLSLAGTTAPKLSFWYHMFGAGMGSLSVEVRSGGTTTTIFTISGQQQTAETDPWLEAVADLTPWAGQSVQLVFVGTRGIDFTGDLAIDDISIFQPSLVDVKGLAVTAPEPGCGLTANEAITFQFQNFGAGPLSSLVASFSIDGGAFTTPENIVGTFQPGDTGTYTFTAPANLSGPGVHDIVVVVTQNTPPDPNAFNDTIFASVQNFIAYSGTYPYFEDFESGKGGWEVLSTPSSSWAFGTPNKQTINSAASGINAWVTGGLDLSFINNSAQAGFYNANEDSYVISPCFDFGTLDTPVIRMSVWWNSEFSWDGAVLQSSVDGGVNWANVGAFGDPDNWYNDNTINGAPGGSQEGWTGRAGTGSGGWVVATHRLDSLGGENQVLLRVAFGADGSVQDNGFAFDNVSITEFSAINGQATAVVNPVTGCGLSDSATVEVQYTNSGTAPVTNYTVSYTVMGTGVTVTESPGGTILPGQVVNYTFNGTANLSATGVYNIKFWINATGDTDAVNDTASATIEHKTAITTFPYFQNFDDTTWVQLPQTFPNGIPVVNLPGDWENLQSDDAQDWVVWSGASGFGTGPSADHTTGLDQYLYVDDGGANFDSVVLVTPCFDVSALNAPKLSFWYHSNNPNTPNDENELHLDVIFNGNLVFDLIPPIAHKDNNWNLIELDLSQYLGSVAFRFRVNNNNNFGNHDIAIDDFSIVDVLAQDAGITAVAEPMGGCGLPVVDTLVLALANLGTDTIFGGLSVNYTINGGSVTTVAINDTIFPGFLIPVSFPGVSFATPGDYVVTAWTSGLTGDTNLFNDSVTTVIKSIPTISTFPYVQDFESGDGGWTKESPVGAISSWGFGTPAKPVIQGAASGVNAWATALTLSYVNSQGLAGIYEPNEDGWVISPCFDFSNLTLPKVEMAVWWSSEFSWDGAVLQSSIDDGTTWQNVGTLGDPDNWYNDGTINGAPGGSQQGWTGTGANSSGGWVTAKNTLTGLGGESAVRLRVAFGSDASVQNDGFAFDDIFIYDTPTDDVGVTAITDPGQFGCSDDSTLIQVQLVNFGIDTAVNVPVFVNVTGAGTTQLSATFPGPLAPGDTSSFVVGFLNTNAGGIFNLAAYTVYLGDSLTFNDTTFSFTDISISAPDPTVFGDSVCSTADSAQFTLVAVPAGNQNIRWFASASSDSIIHVGDTLVTPFLSATTTYYAQATDQVSYGGFAPVNNTIGGGSNYTFFADGLRFDVQEDLVINSVRVYPFAAGTIVVNVLDAGGALVGTASVPFGGTVPDTVITLNIPVPIGTGYQMNANGTTTGGLFRNTGGAVYPYTQSGVVSITSAINNLAGFYYFFYDWVVTSQGCPSSKVPVTATFLPDATVDLGPDGIECAGFVLNAFNPALTSYTWSTGATTPTITADTTGLYYVDVVNTFGCSGSDSVFLSINPSPTVNLGPADTTVCGTLTLDAGNPGSTYVWSEPGQFGQTLDITQSGQYFVTVNLLGCEGSDTMNVTVNPAPAVNLGPDLASCEDVVLDAGNPGATYLWSTGATSQTITVTPPAAGTTTVTVVVTNSALCDASDEIVISAGVAPVVNLGPDQTACNSITLDAGIANASYLWSNGATTKTITVTTSGTYSVTVTDGAGCEGTDEVVLTVEQKPVADFTFVNAQFGFTYDFTSTSQGATSYFWDFGDGAGTSTAANPSYTYFFPGDYEVTLIVENACGKDTLKVRVNGVNIEDELFGGMIRLYPNPTKGEFFLVADEFQSEELSIEVTDVRGRQVYSESQRNVFGGFEIRVDLSGEAEGVYQVKISDGTRTAYKRVIRE